MPSIEASEGATDSVDDLLTISAFQKGSKKLKTHTNVAWKRTFFWWSAAWVQVGNWTEVNLKSLKTMWGYTVQGFIVTGHL